MTRPALLPLASCARRLVKDEDGSASVWSIFWMTMMMIVSGFTLDVSNAYRIRALLQATADASALAAVRELPDADAARTAAISLSQVNMPLADNGNVMLPGMVVVGAWDAESNSFQPGAEPYDAVKVYAARGNGAGLDVPTFLMGLVGRNDWQIAASSTARVRSGVSGGVKNLCPGAIILSTQDVQMGGNNTLTDGVCVHGETEVKFGGSSYFTADVRISSFYPDNIYIGDVDTDSPAGEAEVKVTDPVHIDPVILPVLNTMFDDLWAELYDSGVTTYSGDLLPDFVKDPATGAAKVVRVNQWWWTVQPGDFEPYTIYVVNHGMQMAGKVDAQNIAVIAKGQIGMGGGPRLYFNDVFFFGEGTLNFSGSASYGEPDHYCDDGQFDVYMFSKNRISLGGSSPGDWTYGYLGAAPQFHPGGSFKAAGGIYVEAASSVQVGGNAQIAGCGTALDAYIPIVHINEEETIVVGGALVQ
ncbi:TadG family pilus assembly protein [Albimonas sp. CAU 1670]|uniref:pilus assembly protein TadG-related protein n=1 Tax=Albimonas sp. CAU 1670 TaxID=3032599 RepID=UPI0023DC3797|nr:pilus assembly protein TadG-related protein [Albimonas sp. CAU 1670]MDF2235198.1 TadG family pilus assembly protein [Albimonas sp. CAU 1670]